MYDIFEFERACGVHAGRFSSDGQKCRGTLCITLDPWVDQGGCRTMAEEARAEERLRENIGEN